MGGGGGGKGVCKFFLDGKCTRGDSCAFSHSAEDDDDPEMAEIEAAIAAQEKHPDDEMLAHLDALEEDEPQNKPQEDDGGSSQGDPLPPPASEAEVAEAHAIVAKAQMELVERNKNKAKVATATQNDLQAMINARISRK